MKITVIGASAGVGLEVVKRALFRGHQVTALSRSGLPLPAHQKLTSILGNALKKNDLQNALQGADAVIITLGTGKSKKRTTLFSDFAKVLLGITINVPQEIPFIFLTGTGREGKKNFFSRFFFQLPFLFSYRFLQKDKNKMEKIIVNSHLNWIMIKTGPLKNTPLTEGYKVEPLKQNQWPYPKIGREDMADCMVKLAENTNYKRQFLLVQLSHHIFKGIQ